jgi:dipeptidyl-peptidase-3
MHENAMDDSTLKQYLADDPPTVVPLAIKPHFEALGDKEKKYAHYISRAAFAGTRINLRQVSPESEAIYDFILKLHKAYDGMLCLFAWKLIRPSNIV